MQIKLPVEPVDQTERYILILETIYKQYGYCYFNPDSLLDIYYAKFNESWISVHINKMIDFNYLQKLKGGECQSYIKKLLAKKTVRLNRDIKYRDIINYKNEHMLRKLVK